MPKKKKPMVEMLSYERKEVTREEDDAKALCISKDKAIEFIQNEQCDEFIVLCMRSVETTEEGEHVQFQTVHNSRPVHAIAWLEVLFAMTRLLAESNPEDYAVWMQEALQEAFKAVSLGPPTADTTIPGQDPPKLH